MPFPAMHNAIPPRKANSSRLVAAVLGHGLVGDAFPSPSSDSTPRKPLSSMSRARSTSPNFEEEKAYYGYEDTHQEARAGPRTTLAQAQFPEDNPPRHGSALERVQLLLKQIQESDESDYGYEDMDAIRKLNEYMHSISSEHETMRRRGSAFGRLQDTGDMSVSSRASSDTPPSLPPSRHVLDYWYESDVRATMRRRGSALGRLQDTGASTRTILETPTSLPPSGRGVIAGSSNVFDYWNEPDARAKARLRGSAVGRLQSTGETSVSSRNITDTLSSLPPSRHRIDVGSSDVLVNMSQNEPDARATMRRRGSALGWLHDTGASTRTILETPTSLPPSGRGVIAGSSNAFDYWNEPDARAKARLRGSAVGRLQSTGETSVSSRNITDTLPSLPPSRHRIDVGSSDVLVNMSQNEPDARATMRRRGSALGRLHDTGASTRTILETPTCLKASGRGMKAVSSDVLLNMYQNEPDASATMRRRGSALGRLQDTGASTRTILETPTSLPPSGHGMNAGSSYVLVNMYQNEPDAGATMRRLGSSFGRLQDTGESTRAITDTPPSLPPSRRGMNAESIAFLESVYQHEPDARAKACLRGSALARLQDTGEMSGRNRAITDTPPSLPPSRRGMNAKSIAVLENAYHNKSALARLQDTGEMSGRSRAITDTPPSLPPSRRGMNAESIAVLENVYQTEPDARAEAHLRGSALARLQDNREMSGRSRAITDTPPSLPPSRRGMNAESIYVLENVYQTEPDARAKARLRGSALARLQDTGEMSVRIRAITDTPPSLPPSRHRLDVGSSAVLENVYQHEPDARAKARRRGSAFGRLQDNGEISVSTRAITDMPPSLPPSRCGMNVGSRSSDVVVGVYQNEPDFSKCRRRGSACGRLQKDSKWSSITQAMHDTTPSQPPRRRRMSGESSHAATEVEPNTSKARRRGSAFGRLQDILIPSLSDTTLSKLPRRRRMSVGSSDATVEEVSKAHRGLEEDSKRSLTTQAMKDTVPCQPPSRRQMSVDSSCAAMEEESSGSKARQSAFGRLQEEWSSIARGMNRKVMSQSSARHQISVAA
jgi:hypothetical protein